jgi:hypothetical protein
VSETMLQLHDLSFVGEGDEVVVGRLATGSYAVFPADGAELLRHIAAGMPLSQAAAWYQQRFGEPVDVGDFAATLTELGFVREAGAEPAPVRPVRLRRLGRAVFSPAAWICYGALLVLWLAVALRTSALLPRPGQIFFTGSLAVIQVVITFGQVPLLFLHEGFHTLAGRRLGLPTRMGMSNRLTYIVFETQLNGLMSVPRRARYLPFLAGLLCDGVVFCVLDLVAELTRAGHGAFPLAGRICLALAFTVALRMAWQLQLFLRTDLYYVLATALNCHDLHEASTALLRNRVWRALGRPGRLTDEQQWTERDRRTGTFYGPFIVLGILVMISIAIFGSFPVVREYSATIIHGLGTAPGSIHFWDALISLTFNIAQIMALNVLWYRKRRALAGRRPRLLAEQEH